MKTHTLAEATFYKVFAVCLEGGTVAKVRYLEDVDAYERVALADKTVFLRASEGDRFTEGEFLYVHIGDKIDRRFGKIKNALLGYSRE